MIRKHTFNGLVFSFNTGRLPPGKLGATTGRRGRRLMVVDDRLSGWQMVEVLIHEGLHACFDEKLSEREVLAAGRDITRLLRRALGAPKKRKTDANQSRQRNHPGKSRRKS